MLKAYAGGEYRIAICDSGPADIVSGIVSTGQMGQIKWAFF
jgi:hypothetical protein